jgi:hypothetical protein
MSYTIKNSAQTVTYTVNDGTANTNAISLTLIGKSLANYGTALNENFVYLLENFSNNSSNPPPYPVQGQLWWDNTYKFLNVYDGTKWNTVYGNLATLNVNSGVTLSALTATNATITNLNSTSGIFAGDINVNGGDIFTTSTYGNLFNANATTVQIGGAATIVSIGANTGRTTINNDAAADNFYATAGGQVFGYLTGAIGANSANTGSFTSITTSGTANVNTTLYAATINANVVGNVGSSHYGTIATNAQPYVTSVGTLTGLTVSGTTNLQGTTNGATINATNLYATTIGNTAAAINGNLITGSAVYAGTIGNTSATLRGTLATASQTNITSVGTLTGLSVSGAIVPTSNASINLGGTGSQYFNNVYAVNFLGTSTTAQYADLAEKYLPDADYEVGTVMMVGGTAEVTQHSGAKVRAIGVISAYPAYKMNSDLDGGVYIALKGRVPVKVIGPIQKGQALIGTAHGLAVAQTDDSQWMFAIALQDYSDSGIGLIEAVIL